MAKKTNQAVITALLILCTLLALIYFTGVFYFKSHFPFHTTFLGYDISEKTPSVIDDCMAQETEARTLTLLGRGDVQDTIPLSSAINYRRTVIEPADGWIRATDAWLWPRSIFKSSDRSREASISYDVGRLASILATSRLMDDENVTPPEDAHLEWQDGILVLVPETEGTELNRLNTLYAVCNAIESDEAFLDLDAAGCYLSPSVYRDNAELHRILARYEAISFQQIELDMTGASVILTPDDILAFYNTDEDEGIMSLSESAVLSFVQSLKDEFDTYERSRLFTDHYGNERSVGTWADTYGFKMNLDETTALLIETLYSHESTTIEPVWINRGQVRLENGSDIGDTYIEVSISKQKLWAYIDGTQVLSTDIVSGNSGNHDTPRGVFRILSMKRNALLVGDDYETPVDYWMPITWQGVGLHDADWRSSFGGSIYTRNGSHGCINLPDWAASQLYYSFSSGTPVVIW